MFEWQSWTRNECKRTSRSRVQITLWELFSKWLGDRITSPRVRFGAGGQGVTLKLAWGLNNSSPWNSVLFLMSFLLFLPYFFLSLFVFLFFPKRFPFLDWLRIYASALWTPSHNVVLLSEWASEWRSGRWWPIFRFCALAILDFGH